MIIFLQKRGNRFSDRSSHSLVDIPEAVEKLQVKNPEMEMYYLEPNLELICSGINDGLQGQKALKISDKIQIGLVEHPLKGQ